MRGPAPRVAVLIPALNEEAALPHVLEELPAERVERVVVVDNGSTDRTADVARAQGALVVREPRRGYGRACSTGLAVLLGRPVDVVAGVVQDGPFTPPLGQDDIVVFLDGDHSDFPEELSLLLAPLERGAADFVIGSRVRGGATMEAMLPQAWFGNRLACVLMRVLFGLRASDLGPFRAIRIGALERLGMSDPTFGWTVEMQLKAHVHGLTTVEVPVRYRPRIGDSKITGTLAGTLGAARKILGWIFGWRLRLWWRALRRRGPAASRARRPVTPGSPTSRESRPGESR